MSILADYLAELHTVRYLAAGVPETSYYPPVVNLFNAVGKSLKPKIICISHLQNTGAGIPEAGFFTAGQKQRANEILLQGQKPERGALEVKPFNTNMDILAASEQVRRYLEHYNQVLITNMREFRLLIWENGAPRLAEPEYKLADSTEALFQPGVLKRHEELFPEFLQRVLRRQASITAPSDLAWYLASYAREARWRAENHPLSSFDTIKKALEESLGLKFEGDKGDHFFRSTLVQTLFYGIFSAWVLWSRSEGQNATARFDWRTSAHYLRVPVLRKLFNEVSDPGPLNAFEITEMLDMAGNTLARVDRPAFFSKFSQADAVQYFYEPFLEAFDPELRKELGVWYTPREIVQYMVERVDRLLRSDLDQPLGLASPDVYVLDPCCGTGAYLTAVLDRIHRTFVEQAGDDSGYAASDVREAALTRIFGFEILPAPFVIAHMQLAAQLATLGAPLLETQRAGVYLTNALTGWVPAQDPKASIFPDFQREKEDAEAIKRRPSILVILGNPPYNGYAGIAQMEEESDLKNRYKLATLGLPKPEGKGLNDLYVRFFRIAERRILGEAGVVGNTSGTGIVCLISNSSWLEGFSHPTMRAHLRSSFDRITIDNLNGDKYRTGKTTPEGLPDPSVFSTRTNKVGIQPGTAITFLVRRSNNPQGEVVLRSLWGSGKLNQLGRESSGPLESEYRVLNPEPVLGIPFAELVYTQQYLSWPLMSELFDSNFIGVQTSRDSLLVDIDRDRLEKQLARYLDPSVSHDVLRLELPELMKANARYKSETIRSYLQTKRFRPWQIRTFTYRPFDIRFLYWEPETKLLDEKREDYIGGHYGRPSLVMPKQNRLSYSGPFITRSIVDINGADGGANVFASDVVDYNPLHGTAFRINWSAQLQSALCAAEMSSDDFFLHILAVTHSPVYALGNGGALGRDWPRVPVPATAGLLAHSAALGRRLAELLDAEVAVKFTAEWSFLARLALPQASNLDEALSITAGWGTRGQGSTVMPGRGKSESRPWSDSEREKLASLAATLSLTLDEALTLVGDTCIDIYLTDATLWTAVPANAWTYTLGGYQVLKKWLSYRELPLLGRPLKPEEAKYFSEVVRRITTILLMGPALDASYTTILPTATGLPQP